MFRKLFAFPFKPLFKAAKFFVRIHLEVRNTELFNLHASLGKWSDRIQFVLLLAMLL